MRKAAEPDGCRYRWGTGRVSRKYSSKAASLSVGLAAGRHRVRRFSSVVAAAKRLQRSDADLQIQGFADSVFWERNTPNRQRRKSLQAAAPSIMLQ
jgi:hypothetical protein